MFPIEAVCALISQSAVKLRLITMFFSSFVTLTEGNLFFKDFFKNIKNK